MSEQTVAQQIHQFLGVPTSSGPKQAHGAKNASATKRGPGRCATQGAPGNRISKARPVRAYKALMNAWATMRPTRAALRDDHGAYTLIGAGGFAPRKTLTDMIAHRATGEAA